MVVLSESVEAKITAAQLRWAGHVLRMPEHRIPQQILYGKLCEGERKLGRQNLRYKDTLKQNLKKGNIDPDTWEEQAKDRPQWRAAVYESKSAVEEKRVIQYHKTHEKDTANQR